MCNKLLRPPMVPLLRGDKKGLNVIADLMCFLPCHRGDTEGLNIQEKKVPLFITGEIL